MSAKTTRRNKHTPQRTCVGCRTILPKRTLVRVVRTIDGVQIDPTGKLAGRGAYLHNRKDCWERGLKGALSRALKVELTESDILLLQDFLGKLPMEASEAGLSGGSL